MAEKGGKNGSVLSFTAFLTSSCPVCGLLLLWKEEGVWRKDREGKEKRKSKKRRSKKKWEKRKNTNPFPKNTHKKQKAQLTLAD